MGNMLSFGHSSHGALNGSLLLRLNKWVISEQQHSKTDKCKTHPHASVKLIHVSEALTI